MKFILKILKWIDLVVFRLILGVPISLLILLAGALLVGVTFLVFSVLLLLLGYVGMTEVADLGIKKMDACVEILFK